MASDSRRSRKYRRDSDGEAGTHTRRNDPTPEAPMRKWNVYLYPVLRVKVPVEADTPEAAIAQAEMFVAGAVEAAIEGTKQYPIPGVKYVTYDESDTGEALVEDAQWDDTMQRSGKGNERDVGARDTTQPFSRWYECERHGDTFPWRPKD